MRKAYEGFRDCIGGTNAQGGHLLNKGTKTIIRYATGGSFDDGKKLEKFLILPGRADKEVLGSRNLTRP